MLFYWIFLCLAYLSIIYIYKITKYILKMIVFKISLKPNNNKLSVYELLYAIIIFFLKNIKNSFILNIYLFTTYK